VRALLDTGAWLWFTGSSDRLGPRTRELLQEPTNDLYLSLVSVWEVAIKAAKGKIEGIGDPSVFVRTRLRRQQVSPLGISLDHVLAVASLPQHHGDPFDRLLIAQAQAESLTIVTSDRQIAQYAVTVHDAST
jgi:PIN domain nuclease of toxin-antitoxin system